MTNDAPMSQEKLDEILKEHAEWVESGGKRGKIANLLEANLREAKLLDANLQGAYLLGANLQGAILAGANLRDADLGHASLQKAALSGARMQKAKLSGASLQKANLSGADLQGADLQAANLEGVNLEHANLRGADLQAANLEGADLRRAHWTDLSWATLVKVRWPTWTILDETHIKGARFGRVGWKSPSWLQLKRHYTGVKTLFHLLFLLAFVTPLLLRGVFWVGVNRAQEAFASTATDVRRAADTLLAEGHIAAPVVDRVAATLETIDECLPPKCQTLPIWQVWLGFGQGASAVVPAILLLFYNLIRAGLTWVVGPMRDDEEATGVSPGYAEYKRLVPLHWTFTALFLVAIITAVNAAIGYLALPVSITAPPTP